MGYVARRRDKPSSQEWYERNPQFTTLTATLNAEPPHSSTMRLNYTLPAGRKALVHHSYHQLVRVVAATTVGRASIFTSLAGQAYCETLLGKNGIGDSELAPVTLGTVMHAGNAIQCFTADASTGGSIDYRVVIGLTIYLA